MKMRVYGAPGAYPQRTRFVFACFWIIQLGRFEARADFDLQREVERLVEELCATARLRTSFRMDPSARLDAAITRSPVASVVALGRSIGKRTGYQGTEHDNSTTRMYVATASKNMIKTKLKDNGKGRDFFAQ
jgi:hypothetical protein